MLKIYNKMGRSSVNFTPAYFKRVYKQYKDNSPKALISLMQETLTDSHVNGCVSGRQAGFMSDWSIKPFGGDDATQEDLKRAAIIDTAFKTIDIRLLFKKIHQYRLYSYSVIDFDWDIVDGIQAITGFKHFDQHYFRYDKNGVLKVDFGNRLEEIPETTLVCQSNEMPIMLPVCRDFILKNFGLEIWSAFLEVFGEPFILAKYQRGALNDTEKTELDAEIAKIGRSTRGKLPDDVEIEIMEVKRGTSTHEKYAEYADRGISISILGHANAVNESSGMKIGENLAPYKSKRGTQLDDFYAIEPCMQQVVNIFYRQNWQDGRFPIFLIDKSEPIDSNFLLDALDQYYRQGGRINPDDYRKLGVSVYPDQEPLEKTGGLFDE